MKKIFKSGNLIIFMLPVFCIIFIILLNIVLNIIGIRIKEEVMVQEAEKIAEKNATPTFSIQKIYLCSSANGINIEEKNVVDLYQYTDIAIYINNHKELGLTNDNTIKRIYIDNISLELEKKEGKGYLVYTNILKIGSKEELKNIIFGKNIELNNEKIDFKIVNTNKESESADYDKPTFYADCSNPITLKYINKLNKKYSIGEEESSLFDGSLLQKAGVKIDDINCKIRFKINIVSNSNEIHSVWINFQNPLDDIYKGTSIKSKTTEGREYDFFEA